MDSELAELLGGGSPAVAAAAAAAQAAQAAADAAARAAAEAMAAAVQAQAGSPAGSVHSARSLPRAGPRSAAELLATPRRGGMMTRGEIDKVLRIQSLTACPPGGDPFVEDFYFREAQLRRGGPGAPPNAPQKLREGVGKPGGKRGPTKHVDLSGLGRLALSNVRAPRALMDLRAPEGAASPATAPDGGSEGDGAPLEDSAAVQVRILLESCEGALLDVDDVDRMLAARFGATAGSGGAGGAPSGVGGPGGPGNGGGWVGAEEAVTEASWLREDLEARRGALLDGVCSDLFLPPQASAGPEAEHIFLWIVSGRRGRKLLERLLWRLPPGHAGAAEAVRRSCGDLGRQLFGREDETPADQAGFVGALVRVVAEMPRALVGECLTGFCRGRAGGEPGEQGGAGGRPVTLARLAAPASSASATGVVPFHEGSLVLAAALLRRAGALGAAAGGDAAVWEADVTGLCEALLEGLRALGASGAPGAELQRLIPLDLIRTLLPQLSDAQRSSLRSTLVALQ